MQNSAESFYLSQQANALQQHFEQISMVCKLLVVSLVEFLSCRLPRRCRVGVHQSFLHLLHEKFLLLLLLYTFLFSSSGMKKNLVWCSCKYQVICILRILDFGWVKFFRFRGRQRHPELVAIGRLIEIYFIIHLCCCLMTACCFFPSFNK